LFWNGPHCVKICAATLADVLVAPLRTKRLAEAKGRTALGKSEGFAN